MEQDRKYYEELVEGFRNQVADLERERDELAKLAADRGEEVRGLGEDLRKYEAGLERVVRALYGDDEAEDTWLEEDFDRVVAPMVLRIGVLRERERPLLAVDAKGVRLAGVPVDALEAFLKRYETKASAEAEPVRGALLGVVQELAALMVRHCAPAGAGLLGGTALVEAAEVGGCSCGFRADETRALYNHDCPLDEPLNPGEMRECGAVLPGAESCEACDGHPCGVRRCMLPVGHEHQHRSRIGGLTWGA